MLTTVRPVLCALGLISVSACDAQQHRATYTARGADEATDAGACGCGDGVVSPEEECDPAAPGFRDVCDDACHRTVYDACSTPEECPGDNALCAAYTRDPGQLFCASYCEEDDDCPQLPGYRAVCNFAWCAVQCNHGECPNGMTCITDQQLLDRAGEIKSNGEVCVLKS